MDDFLFVGESEQKTKKMLEDFYNMCNILNIPIAHHKTEGPNKCITFLGIELNTDDMTAKLPPEKLCKYRDGINNILYTEKCTLKELQSVIGMLQFSTSVIPVGKCFLRRLYNATIGVEKPYHYIKINEYIKKDLTMWKTFLDNYNGIAFIHHKPSINSNDTHLFTDSSKTGFGATYDKDFLCGTFPEYWQAQSIELLELYPIFLLVQIFKERLSHKRVLFHCDNEAVVQIINKQSSRVDKIMTLLRPMILTMLNYNIQFHAIHIPGKTNHICDTLSRKQVDEVFLKKHGMNAIQTHIPMSLRPQNLRMM